MKSGIKNVLFVCTGNSCRSVMAEAYFRKRALEEKFKVEIKSAGTLALEGFPPSEYASAVLEENDVPNESFTSKPLSKDLIKWADVILVMDESNRQWIISTDRESTAKMRYLAEFAGSADRTISDPIGGTLDEYNKTFDQIKKSVEGLIKWLKK